MGEGRARVGQAARLVVKVGSSSLTSAEGGLDPPRLEQLADVLAARKAGGAELVLVSSGAIAAGLAPLSLTRRPHDLATAQAAASVGQSLLMARYTDAFARHDVTVAQVLLTADDVTRRSHYRNAQRTLYRLLSLGVLPVVNENDTVATDEIRFGDNDRLAALVAHLVHADLLVLLSDVDGLYDTDPRRPGAALIREVVDAVGLAGVDLGKPGLAGVGTGGMATKVDAPRGSRPCSPRPPTRGRRWMAQMSAPTFTRPGAVLRLGFSGSRTPALRGVVCTSMRVQSRRWSGGVCPCCRPASPAPTERSPRGIRSTSSMSMVNRSRVAWSTSTRVSSRCCSGGRPAS
jgi:uridylate kinase